MKSNNLHIGIIMGFFLPLLASYLFYTFMYHGGGSYIDVVTSLNALHLFGTLLTVSVLPNLLMFFVATKLDYLLAAKGILYSTGFYVILAVIYRFLF